MIDLLLAEGEIHAAIAGGVVGGVVMVSRLAEGMWKKRNGKNGGCPSPMQKLHGERLMKAETEIDGLKATVAAGFERVEKSLDRLHEREK